MMQKVLILMTLSFLLNQDSYSNNIGDKKTSNIRMEGEVKTVSVFNNHKMQFPQSVNNDKQQKTGGLVNKNSLSTSGKVKIYADYLNKESIGYGAYLKLNANPSKNPEITNEIKLYLENKFGRIELGPISAATDKLSVNSYDTTRTVRGLGSDSFDCIETGFTYSNLVINNAFITSPKLASSRDNNSKANKVNVFLPTINGFTLGASFVQDTTSKGATNITNIISSKTLGGNNSYKNVVQTGLRYEGRIGDNVNFATSMVSEFGKAGDFLSYDHSKQKIARNNLAALQVGATLNIQNISFAASYGNQGKSGTAKDASAQAKKLGNYWSVGSSLTKDKYGVSINYMQSNRAGYMFNDNSKKIVNKSKNSMEANKFSALAIGAYYMTMDGLIPLMEYTTFKFHENNNFASYGKYNDGHILLIGTKVQF